MSDSSFAAVSRYKGFLEVIDAEWMADALSDDELGEYMYNHATTQGHRALCPPTHILAQGLHGLGKAWENVPASQARSWGARSSIHPPNAPHRNPPQTQLIHPNPPTNHQ